MNNNFTKNIPNILTVLRMCAVPVFIVFMLKDMKISAIIVFCGYVLCFRRHIARV